MDIYIYIYIENKMNSKLHDGIYVPLTVTGITEQVCVILFFQGTRNVVLLP